MPSPDLIERASLIAGALTETGHPAVVQPGSGGAFAHLDLNGRVRLVLNSSQRPGRLWIQARHSRAEVCGLVRGDPNIVWPTITVAASRPVEEVAREIVRRLIVPAAPMIERAETRWVEHEKWRVERDALVAEAERVLRAAGWETAPRGSDTIFASSEPCSYVDVHAADGDSATVKLRVDGAQLLRVLAALRGAA